MKKLLATHENVITQEPLHLGRTSCLAVTL
jgi:hypothetical protein